MRSIKKIEFEAECYLTGSFGARKLGKRKCSMELFDDGDHHAEIEFIAGDDVEHIGISYNDDKKIYDYDGVCDIPQEAIDLLNTQGFDTTDIE